MGDQTEKNWQVGKIGRKSESLVNSHGRHSSYVLYFLNHVEDISVALMGKNRWKRGREWTIFENFFECFAVQKYFGEIN